jgi:hypothetical protein
MKKAMLILIISAFGIFVMGQKTEKEEKNEGKADVPAVVKNAFSKEFPNAKKTEWEAENSSFEAEFQLDGVEHSANYDKSGHRTELETTIKTDELPKTVLEYISIKYKDYSLIEAARITDNKNVVTYEAEVSLNNESFDLIFDVNGKFLSKESD